MLQSATNHSSCYYSADKSKLTRVNGYAFNKNSITEQTDIAWPQPIPFLTEETASLPYPINNLPNLIRQAIVDYHPYGQQPLSISMIACSALANVSLASQTLANVARDRLLVSPISLYFFIAAFSGVFFATFFC